MKLPSCLLLLGVATLACEAPGAVPDLSDGAPLGSVRPELTGALRVSHLNPRYFEDSTGRIVYLAGSHTWSNLQDIGYADPPKAFDREAYFDSLVAWNHNLTRLWVWEQAQFSAGSDGPLTFWPTPFARTGPGLARDGKARFDLTQFDERFFARLRETVRMAADRGIYVSVMLFNGWSVSGKDRGAGNPWHGHPFHLDNNVNGIDGDSDGDGEGKEVHSLAIPEVTRIQEAYVRRVADALRDEQNVLYEISNESSPGSAEWQYRMIEILREHLRADPRPIGMTVEWEDGDNGVLETSPADWVSPNGPLDDPAMATGSKVVLADTDHFCGICGNGLWVWKSFLSGQNPIFMDPHDGAATDVGWVPDGMDLDDDRWREVRESLGHTISLASEVDLARLRPRPTLASSGYCLADVGSDEVGMLALAIDGTVTLDLNQVRGPLAVRWFFIHDGVMVLGDTVQGGAFRTLRAAFRRDAVVHLVTP